MLALPEDRPRIVQRCSYLRGISPGSQKGCEPVTLISYVLRNARVFDTRDPNTHAQYDITPDLLATNWYTHVVEQTQAPTWDLADTLAADGFHGASYASMHNDLENVALWAWNVNSEAILRVIDQDRRLPKNDKSWR